MNLYDLTGGNYHVTRTVTYPDLPKSQVVFETEVTAVSGKEWSTKISVSGTYDGPTDVTGVKDYVVEWTTDGKTLFEKGSATLQLSSGQSIRSLWSSSIVPKTPYFGKFPATGETLNVSFTPFKIEGKTMSYDWKGTVAKTKQQ